MRMLVTCWLQWLLSRDVLELQWMELELRVQLTVVAIHIVFFFGTTTSLILLGAT